MKKTGFFLRSVRFFLAIIVAVFVLQAVQPARASAPAAPAPQHPQQEAAPETITFAEWGYEDVTLYGPYGDAVYSLGLPAHWQVQPGSTLNLAFDFSVSRVTGLETVDTGKVEGYTPAVVVQIVLNGERVYTINEVTVGKSNVAVPLPDVWPQADGDVNRLQVIMSIHGRCEYFPISSLVIGSDSNIAFTFREGTLPLDLARYPQPFFQRTFQPDNLTIVIPEQPTRTELETAFTIAAGMGALTGNQAALTTLTDAQVTALAAASQAANPRTGHLILVGTPESNTLIADLIKTGALPVNTAERSLSLTTSGPGLVIPGQPATFTIEVKNTAAEAAAGLALKTHLPELAAGVTCSESCSAAAGLVTWQVGRLEAGAAAIFSVTYTLPQDAPIQTAALVTELLQRSQPLNVSSLSAPVGKEGAAEAVPPAPAGDLFFTYNGSAVSESDGILELIASPWQPGKAVLVVTGLTDQAVSKAGRALSKPALFPGMSGPVALIQDILPASTAGGAVRGEQTSFTFADLGYDNETFVGIGQKNIFYQFFIPFDWLLSQDASIRLLFSHSLLLDPEQSSISMFLNDRPIATAALDESNAINGELMAQISARNARPGLNNNLLVLIEGQLPDPCVIPESSQAWVTVSADSTIDLAHSQVDVKGMKDLDYWPQEFITEPTLNDVMLALPQQPAPAEWKIASQIASYLGAANGSGDVQARILLGDPGDADLSAYNILVIGRPTRSPLLQAVNDALPQPFIPGADSILQKVDGVVLRLPDGLELGYLELIPSPWNPDRTLLALTGTSDAAIEQASRYLVDSEVAWQLQGNLAMARADQVFVTDTREQTASAAAQFTATVIPEAAQAEPVATREPAVPTAVAAAEMIEQVTPQTYPERFPYLLPAVLGVGLLLIVGLLLAGLLTRRRSSK